MTYSKTENKCLPLQWATHNGVRIELNVNHVQYVGEYGFVGGFGNWMMVKLNSCKRSSEYVTNGYGVMVIITTGKKQQQSNIIALYLQSREHCLQALCQPYIRFRHKVIF